MKENVITFKTRDGKGRFKTAYSVSVHTLFEGIEPLTLSKTILKKPLFVSREIWTQQHLEGVTVGYEKGFNDCLKQFKARIEAYLKVNDLTKPVKKKNKKIK